MRYQHPVTPAEINTTLAALCEQLAPGVPPLYVDVKPLPDAPANECFHLVDEQVHLSGGIRVMGWSLWEMPGLFVEAEFHAVWLSPDGDYLDIALKARPTARILFLPTPDAVYCERQVNNVRRTIKDDPEVELYLRGFDELFEFLNRGERAEQHGKIQLSGAAVREHEQIENRMFAAHQQIAHRFPVFGPYLPCRCGSGKKAKWCHKSYS